MICPHSQLGSFSFRISCFLWQIKVQLLQVITAFLHKKKNEGGEGFVYAYGFCNRASVNYSSIIFTF